jgi:hypothetical protein
VNSFCIVGKSGKGCREHASLKLQRKWKDIDVIGFTFLLQNTLDVTA